MKITINLLTIWLLIACSCNQNQKTLSNTKWRTVKFTIESKNYLNDFEKKVYSEFDTAVKLNSDYKDSVVLTYVQGRKIDTCLYKINNDTLFYIQGPNRDTDVILKLTNDSLIMRRLRGVKSYAVKRTN